jgi:hypothetical protein
MALVAQAAAGSRRMRDLLDDWSGRGSRATRHLARSIEANRRQQRIAEELQRTLDWFETMEDTL